MQTFLPCPSFKASAITLDRQRLGKQRVETLQILRALDDPYYGWQNHPATQMWRGYQEALVRYGVAICTEWISRGYKDNCMDQIVMFSEHHKCEMPWWFGYEDFHRSHRSNLLRKNPEWYSKFFGDPPDLPYIWPTKDMERELA